MIDASKQTNTLWEYFYNISNGLSIHMLSFIFIVNIPLSVNPKFKIMLIKFESFRTTANFFIANFLGFGIE